MTKKQNPLGIHLNSKAEDLVIAKRLLEEYQEKGDKKNVQICLNNIKTLTFKSL